MSNYDSQTLSQMQTDPAKTQGVQAHEGAKLAGMDQRGKTDPLLGEQQGFKSDLNKNNDFGLAKDKDFGLAKDNIGLTEKDPLNKDIGAKDYGLEGEHRRLPAEDFGMSNLGITPGVDYKQKDEFGDKNALGRDKDALGRDKDVLGKDKLHDKKDDFGDNDKLGRDKHRTDKMPHGLGGVGAGHGESDMPKSSEGGFGDKTKAALKGKGISVKKEKDSEGAVLGQKGSEKLEMSPRQIQQILTHKDKDWVTPFDLGIESVPIAFDVLDFEDKVILKGDFPGFDKKKFEVTVDGNILNIRGTRELDDNSSAYMRKERAFGIVTRQFRLPDFIDESKIWSKFEAGVLTVFCPKEKGARGERVRGKGGNIRIE